MSFLRNIQKFDGVLVSSTFLLVGIGVVVIYSVDIVRGGDTVHGQKQLIALVLGAALFLAASMVSNTFFRATAYWWYVVGLILLIVVLLFGAEVRGTRGWFQLAGFSFQPVEFMKIGLVLLFATFASRQERYFKALSFFMGSAALVIFPMVLVFLQPDLGSAMLLGFFWLAMVLLLRVKWRYVFGLIALVVIVAAAGWVFLLAPYQKDRLIIFVQPEHDPLGAGYNIQQSLIAVGSGQWSGRGLGLGPQSQLRFLPESQTDFIFAVIAESFGLIGSFMIIALFVVLWYRLTRAMLSVRDDFSLLVLVGTLVMISTQWLVNIGATVGLLPVTGVPMPLLSYGGSSLVSTLLLLGVAHSMYVSKS